MQKNHSISQNIFLVSVFGLFTELMLIRWFSTEVNIFAYLQNIILITCFLGFGIGCFIGKKQINDWLTTAPLALLILALTTNYSKELLGRLSVTLSLFGDMIVWNMGESASHIYIAITLALVIILVILSLICLTFIPIGSRLGWLMNSQNNTINAYSINIFGSLIGILGFVFLSNFNAGPLIWLITVIALYAVFLIRFSENALRHIGLLTVLLTCIFFSSPRQGEISTTWSPYQKLTAIDCQQSNRTACKDPFLYAIHVNNTGYQWIKKIGNRKSKDITGYNYQIPYILNKSAKSALVVGSGTGNDVSAAINNDVERILAVEIDPVIANYGKELHPNEPYSSEKVELVIDDARSVFDRTNEKFDVIVFGLLDSHTTTALTNARLDHYVYTVESIKQAKQLLNPDGLIVLSFQAVKPFIAEKLVNVFLNVFEKDQIKVMTPGGVTVIVAGSKEVISQTFTNLSSAENFLLESLDNQLPSSAASAELLTDDWPYIYLEGRFIPKLFYFSGLILLLVFFVICRYAKVPMKVVSWKQGEWHFFFLGAGFLLLEVQNVSKLAILFGSTWSTNAIVISSIMLMILAANFVVNKFPSIPTKLAYTGLLLSCIGLYIFDLGTLSALSAWSKVILAGAITSLPIFFSGIVFITSFAKAKKKNEALGANMFGSLVGGFMQCLTFIIGVKALLLVVFSLYSISWILKRAD